MIVWWRATKIHWLKKYHEIAYHIGWRGSLYWKVQEAIAGTTRFGQKAIKHIHARFPFFVCFEVKVECLFPRGLNEIGDKWVKCNSRSCSILQMGLNQLQPAWPHLFKLVSGRCYSVQTSSSHNDPQLHWSSLLLCTDQDRALRDVAMMQIVPLTRAKMMQQCTLCQLKHKRAVVAAVMVVWWGNPTFPSASSSPTCVHAQPAQLISTSKHLTAQVHYIQ